MAPTTTTSVAPTTTTSVAPTTTTTTVPARAPTAIRKLGAEGSGIVQPVANAPLPVGWTETEYLFGGTATSYQEVGSPEADGFWDAAEDGRAEYLTRMIVRLPPPETFSGVVLVEWFNVTAGTDTSPDWGHLAEEIGRSGYGWVGVSAQRVGVHGVKSSWIAEGLIDTRGLREKDSERYGDLHHPGDAYSYDMFTQAGNMVAGRASVDPLVGFSPTHVIAMGESQSAGFMTTYVNAVHPLVRIFDGFLIHSRGNNVPDLQAERPNREESPLVRTDLEEPILIYVTETDLVELGYASARQDDSGGVLTWEVAGTAHADAYSLHAAGLPRDASVGSLLGCSTPINDGPQHETLQAAVHHLTAWVVNGTRPPTSPRIVMADNGTIARDDLGLALGGIRTPQVDAPVRVVSGQSAGDGGACFLFGQTSPFDQEVLTGLYADEATYLEALQASVDQAVAAGWLLPEDAATMAGEEATRASLLGLG